MKKTLFLIGAFLLIESGVSLCCLLAHFVQAYINGEGLDPKVVFNPTEMLVMLFVANLFVALASILICRKGFKAPFVWNLACASKGKIIALSLLAMVPLMYLTNVITELMDLPDWMAEQFQMMSLEPWALCVLAVVGPVAEELCFRYGMGSSLLESRFAGKVRPRRWQVIVVLLTSLIFGVIHGNPSQMFGAFSLGLFLGWLYVETRNVWAPLVCHVFNNAIAVAMLRILPADAKLNELTPDTGVLVAAMGGAMVLAGLLIWLLWREFRKVAPKEGESICCDNIG